MVASSLRCARAGLLAALVAGCAVHASGSANLDTGVHASASADAHAASAPPATPAPPPPVAATDAAPKSKTLLALDIDFEFDRAKLTPADQKTLADHFDEVCKLVAKHDKLTIEGHADSRGPADRNLSLSQGRSEAVREALLANKRCHIGDAQLVAVGYGEKEPRRCHEPPECDSKDHGPKSCEDCWNENRMTILSIPEDAAPPPMPAIAEVPKAPPLPGPATPAARSGCSRVLVLGEERGSRMCE